MTSGVLLLSVALAAPLTVTAPVNVTVTEHVLTTEHVGTQHVVVISPSDASPTRGYPGLVAYAGLGEARRGNKAGAWGWVEKYGLLPAIEAMQRGRLSVEDAQGLLNAKRLAAWNKELKAAPYSGLIIVCPFPSKKTSHHDWVVETLLPWAEETVHVTPGRWGVDGISLGGGVSSVVGFAHPEAFMSIGSLQGAVTQGRRTAVERSIARWQGDWSARSIQIITSRGDGFRPALTDFHRWLDRRRIVHRFEVLPGRHNKAFVKGPGVLRMLMFHNQALRR